MVIDLVRSVGSAVDCTTSNIIYCITCTLCNKLYIGESGRKLGDRFREYLLDVKNKGSDLSKPVNRDTSIFRATRADRANINIYWFYFIQFGALFSFCFHEHCPTLPTLERKPTKYFVLD